MSQLRSLLLLPEEGKAPRGKVSSSCPLSKGEEQTYHFHRFYRYESNNFCTKIWGRSSLAKRENWMITSCCKFWKFPAYYVFLLLVNKTGKKRCSQLTSCNFSLPLHLKRKGTLRSLPRLVFCGMMKALYLRGPCTWDRSLCPERRSALILPHFCKI